MRINHNIASLNTYRQLSANGTNTQKSLEKLSSGLRINRAGDDAAGLAISEKMRGQIRGLDQASRNSQDAISLIQTAEGALNETHSILQRMRELAVQGASDTLAATDRNSIADEITQLKSEIDRIATTTEFNTKKLLDGSTGEAVSAATKNIFRAKTGATDLLNKSFSTADTLVGLTDKNGNALGLAKGDTITVRYSINGTQKSKSYTIASTTNTLAALKTVIDAGEMTLKLSASTTNILDEDGKAIGAKGILYFEADNAGVSNAITSLSITAKDANGVERNSFNQAFGAFTESKLAKDQRDNNSLNIQIGANENQSLTIDIESMDKNNLGITGVSVENYAKAKDAISVIDRATARVSTERSKLGALQNRLEHTINNLGTSSENLTASESRIRDVDMAKEMMEFTKNNILTQAAQSMLAQANQQPQGVLQLLR
jgi:flagellin